MSRYWRQKLAHQWLETVRAYHHMKVEKHLYKIAKAESKYTEKYWS